MRLSEFIDRSRRRIRFLLRSANYGRAYGWTVELAGKPIAILEAPHWGDMFWTSYRLAPPPGQATVAPELASTEFWKWETRVRFRNQLTGDIAPFVIPCLVAEGQLSLRGDYFLVGDVVRLIWADLRQFVFPSASSRVPTPGSDGGAA